MLLSLTLRAHIRSFIKILINALNNEISSLLNIDTGAEMGVRKREEAKSSEDNFETKFAGEEQMNEVIPVIEEEIIIDKKVVKKGTTVIEKKVSSEEVSVDVPVITEHLNIERVGMNQFLDSQPSIRYEGDTMIIPVTREVVVKRLLLVEEIRVSKQLETTNQSEKITLKKEEVKVKKKEK